MLAQTYRRRLPVAALSLLVAATVAVMVFGFSDSPSRSPRGLSLSPVERSGQKINSATLRVAATKSGRRFQRGSIGLSTEYKELSTTDLSADHPSLVRLMRLLGTGVFRIGGGSLDRTWWTNGDEQPPSWAADVVSPADLDSLGRFATATGWRIVLGVNLGHFEPARAAREAATAQRILGSSLMGFEIGNEPDVYRYPAIDLRAASYDLEGYLADVQTYEAAIKRAVPDARLFGPDLHSSTWLSEIASLPHQPFAVLTQHFYPTTFSVARGACASTPVPSPAELFSPEVRATESAVANELVEASEFAGSVPAISETNATGSCDTFGGPRTSPVFANGLWALDWTLRAASAGVRYLNFNGYFGHCAPTTGSPICAPSYFAESQGRVIARPEYYGLFAAAQLQGGRFLTVEKRSGHEPGYTTAYATVHPDGRVTIALDNLSTRLAAKINLVVPQYRHAIASTLIAPSVTSRTDIRFGGEPVTPSSDPTPPGQTIQHDNSSFSFRLPPASAVIVNLRK